MSLKRHIIIGVSAGFLLLLVYAGVITLAQGWQHMLEQTAKLWYWIAALAAGFGIQAGLFSFIRQALRKRKTSATASIATAGGISAGSMVACCAHHLGDLLPLIGMAGLAAFLVRYQSFFIILGVMSNIVGITIMLQTIQRHSLCPWVASWKWDMGRVTKGVMASAALVLIVVGVRTLSGT
ncbi:MAG: hypothetical protein Q7R57_02295 [Dehalococcoidales bacterium]|nr:hypothetical protein [Dehalococcoidales bacterium]